jgi:hypothetical protein
LLEFGVGDSKAEQHSKPDDERETHDARGEDRDEEDAVTHTHGARREAGDVEKRIERHRQSKEHQAGEPLSLGEAMQALVERMLRDQTLLRTPDDVRDGFTDDGPERCQDDDQRYTAMLRAMSATTPAAAKTR